MKDSFEKAFILPADLIIGNLITNKIMEVKIIVPINASKQRPLCGSFANECTLSIIPDLTMKAPKRLNEKTDIDNYDDLCQFPDLKIKL